MKLHPLYPLMFRPIYKDRFWGGNAIAETFNRPHTPTPCAEAWELSALEGDDSIVVNGAFEGVSLGELTRNFGRELLGEKAPEADVFPLLFKLVDVQSRCSVQVHPDVATAAELGVRSKHELWYFLNADPDATLWAGAMPGPESFEGITSRLFKHAPRAGDVFDIPPGLIHALGGKSLVFEVQQSSSAAFRIDDWGRGRETQLDAALKSMKWEARVGIYPEPPANNRELRPRITTPDFTFATLDLRRTRTLRTTLQSFMVLFCATGKTTLSHGGPHPLTLLPGDLVLIPPKHEACITPLAEKTRLLVTTL
jgi:mannose-6-phosphate isomerase